MKISPLEQLYLETTSKEDLLAEINDQRRQVIEARGVAAEMERRLLAAEKALSEQLKLVDQAQKTCRQLGEQVAQRDRVIERMRKKYNDSGLKIKPAVIALLDAGLSNKEIEAKGFNPATIRSIRHQLNVAATQGSLSCN